MIKLSLGLLMGLIISCATTQSGDLLRFVDREFLVHPDKPGMGFPYSEEVCVARTGIGRILGKRCTTEWHDEFYDFNDNSVRQKFIDSSCTMKCAGRFKY